MWIKYLISIVFLVFSSIVSAEPFGKADKFWASHRADDTRIVDHSSWQQFLNTYVVAKGEPMQTFVSYSKVSTADKNALNGYLAKLQSIPIREYNRSEQRAFWINLYNAKTVELVISHYPVDSIRDIRFGLFSIGPWDEKLLTVEGKSLSLNDIEHSILRPLWRDNRIHYAVNCASFGCPNLNRSAFTAASTETLLSESAVAYVNHQRGVNIQGENAVLSSIYKWYAEDFGEDFASLKRHLIQYARPELAAKLQSVDDVDYDYDWHLNDDK